jgi:hypothetical protein
MLRGWEVLVRPVLEYGAEIWGEKKWKEGEALQIEMGRRVLGVNKLTTREVIQGELGLTPIINRRILLRLKFWEKLINMNKSRLVYKIYKQRRIDFIKSGKKDKKNWCYWTWKYLKDLHLEHFWESEQISESESKKSNFSKLVKDLLNRKEQSEWRERIEKKPKLRLYNKLKDRLVVEDYVLELDRDKRRQLTMLRGGTNKLRIETGRWRKESEKERVCNVCLCEEVEDEKHFLLSCPTYVRERSQMFMRIREECQLEDIEKMDLDWQLQLLIGVGWRKKGRQIREIVLDYISKAYKIRKKYI